MLDILRKSAIIDNVRRGSDGKPPLTERIDRMSKIDFRHHYVLVLDTETANTTFDEDGRMDSKSVLMYDCGWSVVDTHGGIYKEQSFVNRDIFVNERELMESAYYAKKIP